MTRFPNDLTIMRNPTRWPGETLCLKKLDHSAFGVIINDVEPVIVYLRGDDPKDDFKQTMIYHSFEEMMNDGWVVD
jgi:hypothetical protein